MAEFPEPSAEARAHMSRSYSFMGMPSRGLLKQPREGSGSLTSALSLHSLLGGSGSSMGPQRPFTRSVAMMPPTTAQIGALHRYGAQNSAKESAAAAAALKRPNTTINGKEIDLEQLQISSLQEAHPKPMPRANDATMFKATLLARVRKEALQK